MTQETPEYLQSELPAIELFDKLQYEYFCATDNDPRESINEVVLEDRLVSSIKKINPWISENNLKNAAKHIMSIPAASLMEANEQIHEFLRSRNYSVNQVIDGKEQYKGVAYVDFDNIDNNDFLVVNQMKFKGKEKNSIPDLIVFLNGMPVAVIECKSSKRINASDEAISDLLYYQKNSEKLFHFNQICAGIYKVGGKYGALGAKSTHYQVYRSEDTSDLENLIERPSTPQDILLYNLFKKENFLDIIRNFTIFEVSEGSKIKKLPRYQQIRATNKTIKKLQETGQGGVVWHTQGSGKSITMIYLATKLRREENNFNNPTIIIMTDRVDLDDQISKTFQRCGFENPIQATSINHLKGLLRDSYGKTIMTTIFKFQEYDADGNVIKVKDIKEEDIEILTDKENVFVLVDEAHRSHYGPLAGIMRRSLINAKFIAFTGTPIDKETKSTLGSFYGGKYLDVYNIKQSVEDGSTLPILYEDGLPEMYVEKELLEAQFDKYFENESDEKKELLKQKASNIEKYMLAKQRIRRVAEHIIEHYKSKIYPDGHKAMVVCHNRAAAIAYKKVFDELKDDEIHNFRSRVVMSFSPKKDPDEYLKIATPEQDVKSAIEDFKLPFGDESDLSRAGKKQFNNDALIIVSDMLLTGYDAPVVQVMYLDKILKEHNLLQAIARVNRTKMGKKAGFLVDYCGITQHLVDALKIFAGDLDPADVMVNTKEELTILDNRHRQLVAFFRHLKEDCVKERETYIDKAVHHIEPEDLRDQFKDLLKKFNTSMNIVLPDPAALKYQSDFYLYNEIKLTARNMYEDETLKVTAEESKKLQKLIDEHLRATGIQNLLEEPVSIIDAKKFREEINKTISDKSKQLKMANAIRHRIKVEIDKNPDFYKPLAERLEELIKARKEERISQIQLFDELEKIQQEIINKNAEASDLGFKSEREFAVFKTLETKIEGDAQKITGIIFKTIEDELKIDNWENKETVHKSIRMNIKEILRGKVPKDELQSLSVSILNVIVRND